MNSIQKLIVTVLLFGTIQNHLLANSATTKNSGLTSHAFDEKGNRINANFIFTVDKSLDVSTPEQIERLYKIFKGVTDKIKSIHRNNIVISPEKICNAYALVGNVFILTEAIIKELSDDELEAIIAHEIGHQQLNHAPIRALIILRSMIMSGISFAGIALSLSLRFSSNSRLFKNIDVSDFSTVAFLAFFIESLNSFPRLCRAQEFEADEFAVKITQNPKALAAALTKLEQHNLNFYAKTLNKILYYNFLFAIKLPRLAGSSHPTTADRIKKIMAIKLAETK